MKIVEEIKKNWKKILIDTGIAVGCGILGYVIGKKRKAKKTNYYYKHDKYYKK